MSDILVDHQPIDLDFHFQVQNKKVGLGSSKKKKIINIENWTDAFSIYSSVLRKANPNDIGLAEDLTIYMDLIRQIQKDGGDWYNYDVTFRRTKERDDTLPWSQVDQILYSRSLFKKPNSQSATNASFNQPFRRTCYKFNEGRFCAGGCGYPHLCFYCYRPHPKLQCRKQRSNNYTPVSNSDHNKKPTETTANATRPNQANIGKTHNK